MVDVLILPQQCTVEPAGVCSVIKGQVGLVCFHGTGLRRYQGVITGRRSNVSTVV